MVEFWLLPALGLIVVGRLLRPAWTTYRWEAAPAAAHDHRRAVLGWRRGDPGGHLPSTTEPPQLS